MEITFPERSIVVILYLTELPGFTEGNEISIVLLPGALDRRITGAAGRFEVVVAVIAVLVVTVPAESVAVTTMVYVVAEINPVNVAVGRELVTVTGTAVPPVGGVAVVEYPIVLVATGDVPPLQVTVNPVAVIVVELTVALIAVGAARVDTLKINAVVLVPPGPTE